MPVGQRKGWAQQLQAQHNISIVVSCQIVCISRTAYYYEPKLIDDDAIVDKLTELTDKHTRWGLPMCGDGYVNSGMSGTISAYIGSIQR